MRRREQIDPTVARELAAIDAALAGNPSGEIAPEDAELAQLATLLVAERPTAEPAVRARLDARVASRFAGARKVRAPTTKRVRRTPLIPAFAVTTAVALVALVIALPRGGSTDSELPAGGAAMDSSVSAPGSSSDGDATAPEAAAAPQSEPPVGGFQRDSGRKVEQSATVELGAPAARVDEVAQGVLNVVARQGGIVDQSSVATSGDDGRATFALRIPAARLQTALGELSRLPDAHVLSRTDDSTDVNQAYVSVRRRLDGAEAERTSLLTALRAATSDAERDRVSARLEQVDGQIAELERAQRALDRRVDYSRVDLTVRADDRGAAADEDDGSVFSPGAALDDAGRLLSVTAGVVVIVAAALVPVALVALLGWPLARAARRRRREHALDHA